MAWGALAGLVLLALVGGAIAHALGMVGGTQHSDAATLTPTVTATPPVSRMYILLDLATHFGRDMVLDDGADAYTLLTPQAQAQTTPQQLTAALRPPPNVIFKTYSVDPTHSTHYGAQATMIGDLTLIIMPDPSPQRINVEFYLDQQPDASWRVTSYTSPYS
jgi:hypothetical protein